MACGLLVMLLMLGPTLSEGAAGCFYVVSGSSQESPETPSRRQPPTTRVTIDGEDGENKPQADVEPVGQTDALDTQAGTDSMTNTESEGGASTKIGTVD